MAAPNYEDIVINQGTDVAIEIHLMHDSGSAYNLTNVINPAEDGILNLSLTNTQTDVLKTRGRYVYDVEISYVDSDSNTIIQRVLEGQIEVSPSVTK